MNQGQTVFSQFVEPLPRRAFDNAIIRYRGDRRVRSLSCMDQLLCMIFAQVTGRSSLRETVLCLSALGNRLYHCGIRGVVRRSTLADANEKRDYRIFMDLAMAMIEAARLELPVDRELGRLEARVFALDSTTIDLCLKLFPWARFRRRKGGVKAHIMIDLLVGIPVFMRVTQAKTHDLWSLDQFVPLLGAYYVFDKGYVDFARLYRFHRAGAFFVTRAKKNMVFGVRQRFAISGQRLRRDRIIRLRGIKSRVLYPEPLRLIHYVDPETGKRFKFLTNNLTLDALTIALLYRRRWRIELFFKWIKQHLHVKVFFGNSPNAVKIQLWVAVIVYVLVLRLKKSKILSQEPNEIFQILSLTILEKTPVIELFSEFLRSKIEREDCNQLSLFD